MMSVEVIIKDTGLTWNPSICPLAFRFVRESKTALRDRFSDWLALASSTLPRALAALPFHSLRRVCASWVTKKVNKPQSVDFGSLSPSAFSQPQQCSAAAELFHF